MAERERYRVYVDETGDPGWGGRSSPVFVLSGLIVRDSETDAVRGVLDRLTEGLGKPEGAGLHWAQNIQRHQPRKYVARELAAAPVTIAYAVTIKPPMMGTDTGLADPTRQYNYAVRRLLERVSWFVDDSGGEAAVTLGHVRGSREDRLTPYLKKLQERKTQIRWDAIGSVRREAPDRVRLLQAADLAAGCCHSAFRPDTWGDFEPGYLMTIAPRIYRSSGKPITSYGMNIIGTKGCEKEYPWWSDFAKACREGGP